MAVNDSAFAMLQQEVFQIKADVPQLKARLDVAEKKTAELEELLAECVTSEELDEMHEQFDEALTKLAESIQNESQEEFHDRALKTVERIKKVFGDKKSRDDDDDDDASDERPRGPFRRPAQREKVEA